MLLLLWLLIMLVLLQLFLLLFVLLPLFQPPVLICPYCVLNASC